MDARDTIAELTERAQEISREAGTRVSLAMKDVISAAAGIAGFAVESARDLVQFMVRRGQMTPEEGDKLIRDAESAHSKRPARERNRPTASEIAAKQRAADRARAAAERDAMWLQMRSAARAPAPAKKSAATSSASTKKAKAGKTTARKAAAGKPAKKAAKKATRPAKAAKRAPAKAAKKKKKR